MINLTITSLSSNHGCANPIASSLPNGSIYFHIDYREVHYCKMLLDQIFGREAFLTRSSGPTITAAAPASAGQPNMTTSSGTPKIRTITSSITMTLRAFPIWRPDWSVKEKAERGKLPTDTWWHTIVATNSHEKTGYPTQKPLGILRRIIQASSTPVVSCWIFLLVPAPPARLVWSLDGEFILIDNNDEALGVMANRFRRKKKFAGLVLNLPTGEPFQKSHTSKHGN